MSRSVRSLSLLLLLMAALPAWPQQYKWVDQSGHTQYSDTPPPASAKNVERKRFTGSVVGSGAPYEVTLATKNFPVTLYTSPPCGESCTKARDALNKRGIPFKEVQVWDEETNAEIRRISNGSEVPVLLVGRSMQKGFEQGAFDRLLDLAGYPKAGIVPAGKQTAPPMPDDYQPKAANAPDKPAQSPPAAPDK